MYFGALRLLGPNASCYPCSNFHMKPPGTMLHHYADKAFILLVSLIGDRTGLYLISDNNTGRYRQPRWPVAPVGGRADGWCG